jgi:molecular chaperone DnaJ
MAANREWFEKDYYKVLGVSESASEKELTRAYRRLAKAHHPDANPGSEDKFKEISAAYDVLGDPARRKEYDEVRRMGPIGGFGPQRGATGPGGFGIGDLSDLLGGLFGGAGRAPQGVRRGGPVGPARGEDLEASLHLSFADAANGLTTSVNITSDVSCGTCGGVGAAPGTTPIICTTCAGRGTVDDNQGFFSFSQPCRTCRGTGMKIETPCKNCKGSGLERRPRQIKVRIPAGVDDGTRIRIKQRGGAGHNGGPPGDLFVTVNVSAHDLFGRKGKDLTLRVPVTVTEALLGTTVRIPTLAEPVSLKVPAGTKSGKTFRVRAQAPSTSDLLVTIDVVFPEILTDEQKAAVEALAATLGTAGTDLRKHLGV